MKMIGYDSTKLHIEASSYSPFSAAIINNVR